MALLANLAVFGGLDAALMLAFFARLDGGLAAGFRIRSAGDAHAEQHCASTEDCAQYLEMIFHYLPFSWLLLFRPVWMPGSGGLFATPDVVDSSRFCLDWPAGKSFKIKEGLRACVP